MAKNKYPTKIQFYAWDWDWILPLPFQTRKQFYFNLLHLDLQLFNQPIYLGIGWGTDYDKIWEGEDKERKEAGLSKMEMLFYHHTLRLGQAIYNALAYRLKQMGDEVTNENVGMLLHGAKAEDLEDLLEKSGKELNKEIKK